MENLSATHSTSPVSQPPVPQNPLLWVIVVLLVLSLAGNAFLFFQLSEQLKVSNALAQQAVQQMPSASSSPMIEATDSQKMTPFQKAGLDLQAYLRQNCKPQLFGNSYNYTMAPEALPFTIGSKYQVYLKPQTQYPTIWCVSQVPPTSAQSQIDPTASLGVQLIAKGLPATPENALTITAYDSKSVELGHDGLPFFGNGTTVVSQDEDITYSVDLDIGIMATPESVPLVLRAVRKMGNDQQNYSIIFLAGNVIPEGDPALVELLKPYSKMNPDSQQNELTFTNHEQVVSLLNGFVAKNKSRLTSSPQFLQAQDILTSLKAK